MYDVQDLADVVQRLAGVLEVTTPVDPTNDVNQVQGTPEDAGQPDTVHSEWCAIHETYGVYQRTTMDGVCLWHIGPQTGRHAAEGWWDLQRHQSYDGLVTAKNTFLIKTFPIKAPSVWDAMRKADRFIHLFHLIPLDSSWTLRSVDPVSCVCGTGDLLWEVVDTPYGYTLRCPQSGPESWTLLSDEIPGVLTEADGIIERREVARRHSREITPAPPSGPRIAGEDD